MDDRSGKVKDTSPKLPPWKQATAVRPEILAAFQKWKDDPESVYKDDKLAKRRVKMTPSKNTTVDFVIPERIRRRQYSMAEPNGEDVSGRRHGVQRSLAQQSTSSGPTTPDAVRWEQFPATTSSGHATPTAPPRGEETTPKWRRLGKNEKLVLVEASDSDEEPAKGSRPMSPVNLLVPMSIFSNVGVAPKHGNLTMEQRIHEQNIHRMMAVSVSMTRIGAHKAPDPPGKAGGPCPVADGVAVAASGPGWTSSRKRLQVAAREVAGRSSESLNVSRDLPNPKLIHFGVCCLADSCQVRIRDIRCDALVDDDKSASDIHPFLKLHMTSSEGAATSVTRTTGVLMATKEPRFDDVIYFDFSPDRFHKLSLEIEICSRIDPAVNGGVKLLGGAAVGFYNMEIGLENHMTEEIQEALKYDEAKEEQISLTIERASAVHAKNQQPMLDSYVTIGLSQPGKQINKARTLIQKNSSDPVFDEKFVFHISPKIDDLRYTSISLSLKQRRQMRSDKTIGQVRFGFGATQHTEAEHWHTVLHNPGISCKRWHTLFQKQ